MGISKRLIETIASYQACMGDDGLICDGDCCCKQIARAALIEMKEPTEGMLRNGMEALFACDDGYEASMRAAWNAMIDAALDDKE